MVIITGPGRSGTSVLALFCQQAGYDPGGQWNASVDAGLEYPRVVDINDALLGELWRTGQAERTLAAYGEEMRQLALPVIKDPRFTFHPGILRAWRTVRDDLSVVLTYRKPEYCLASRKRKADFLHHPTKADSDTLRKDFADIIECLLELNIPFRILLFPYFLDQYSSVHSALTALGLSIEEEHGRNLWRSLANRKKVHFGASPASAEETRSGLWRFAPHPLTNWWG